MWKSKLCQISRKLWAPVSSSSHTVFLQFGNAEFQRLARGDERAFLSEQCKEREEDNRMGKTRDLLKKMRNPKGTFHAKMGSIKNRNGTDLNRSRRYQEEVARIQQVVVVHALNHVRLFVTPWTVTHQAPPSMGFSRHGYWSGLPCSPPGDLSDPGIEPMSPALAGELFTAEPPGKPCVNKRGYLSEY